MDACHQAAAPAEPNDDLTLLRRYAATRERAVRNAIVERHMGLAAHIARRFGRTGTHDDDLRQVAMIGLVKAVDRFDPALGHSFVAFAGSTIEGELKRHFRDASWVVRVPRAAKELHLQLRRAVDELQQRSGRSPSVDELAAYLGLDREDVLRGLAASAAYHVGALDASATSDEGPLDRAGALAQDDEGFERIVDTQLVGALLERLPAREQEIVRMRFYEQMSQSDIAESIGMSQMHVSRLLRRAFEQLRTQLDDVTER